MAKKERPRTSRRVRQQKLRRLVRERERLAELEPGGSPERPMEVPSPAVVELRAGAIPCIQCEGALGIEEHAVREVGSELLRLVRARCRTCGTPRELWFRIARSGPN